MYSPFLKSKQSEGLALQHLKDDVRQATFPFIDLAAPTTKVQKKDPPAHVVKTTRNLARYVSAFSRIMIDSSEMDADLRTPDGVHPLLAAVKELEKKGVDVVPITGLARDKDHVQAVCDAIQQAGGSTVGIRIEPYDLETPTLTAKLFADLIVERFGNCNIILIYDLRTVYGADISTLKSRVLALDEKLPHGHEEMTIVSGSGLPERMADAVPTKSSDYIQRVERELWDGIKEGVGDERTVTFGDYATVTPDYVELDFALIYKQIGPKIIYALDEEWFVIRGGSFERHPDGRSQYYFLAEEITKLEDFPGEDYCYGDDYIRDKAGRVGKPGSPASWVTTCVNRHISRTARNPP